MFDKKIAFAACLTFAMTGCATQDTPAVQEQSKLTSAVAVKTATEHTFTKDNYLTRNIQDEIFYFVMQIH